MLNKSKCYTSWWVNLCAMQYRPLFFKKLSEYSEFLGLFFLNPYNQNDKHITDVFGRYLLIKFQQKCFFFFSGLPSHICKYFYSLTFLYRPVVLNWQGFFSGNITDFCLSKLGDSCAAEQRPGMPLNILQCRSTIPTARIMK